MSKYLIEVPHEAEQKACALAVKVLLSTGSHFLTNADFGCGDGEHKGWITLDAGSKEEARSILPVAYRSRAKIVKLNKFNLKELDDIIGHHGL